ncbi:MAG TPA: histidine phosphatase family protein [Stellaceae bacterium]
MKTVHLLRHAKSSWKDPALADHDRPLAKRGRKAAKTIAAYLKERRIAPDLVICSTAARARQTFEPIAKAIKPPKVVLEEGIYEVAERELWQYLRALPEEAESVLLIGHNPGMHDLALALADAASRRRLPPPEGKFPAGAMASFRFDGRWKELRPGRAALAAFATLKEMATER